ncbi:AcrR family transcriptional regulator [Sphingobium jiangsuense]|uniref:AcrR family transcriptional regulator n=1 Tax=Sphingobium jiangsuense TaxID=870476 RepID=A0A7W6FQE1_9SPHN|nr:TetR/AcrR family transcriptional regulator [Sphingobium jiangsuense]MBB3926835.1 AcrR family transcriptional regulator [Sphingobium jiangsuense]
MDDMASASDGAGERLENPAADSPTDSKVQLILAGERLFARRGMEGASLREIAVAAGHGNNNAVRYHFGSKEGLVQAIFLHRVAQLEPLRHRLIGRVDERKLTGDVRSLMEVIVLPYLTLRDSEGRFSYPSFLLQYLLHYRPKGMMHAADDASAVSPSLHRTMDLLRRRLFYLAPEAVERRIMVATSTFLAVLINTENLLLQPDRNEFRSIIDDTLCQMVASLTAPASRVADFIDDSFTG